MPIRKSLGALSERIFGAASKAARGRLGIAAGGAAGAALGGPGGAVLGMAAVSALNPIARNAPGMIAGAGRASLFGAKFGMAAAAVGVGAVGWGAIGAGFGTVIGAPLEIASAMQQSKSNADMMYMGRMMKNQQTGPFGTGDRPYGLGSNFNSAAGMSLALHYANNGTGLPNPLTGLANSAPQGAVSIGSRMLGS